jgi:hypothetical protein
MPSPPLVYTLPDPNFEPFPSVEWAFEDFCTHVHEDGTETDGVGVISVPSPPAGLTRFANDGTGYVQMHMRGGVASPRESSIVGTLDGVIPLLPYRFSISYRRIASRPRLGVFTYRFALEQFNPLTALWVTESTLVLAANGDNFDVSYRSHEYAAFRPLSSRPQIRFRLFETALLARRAWVDVDTFSISDPVTRQSVPLPFDNGRGPISWRNWFEDDVTGFLHPANELARDHDGRLRYIDDMDEPDTQQLNRARQPPLDTAAVEEPLE